MDLLGLEYLQLPRTSRETQKAATRFSRRNRNPKHQFSGLGDLSDTVNSYTSESPLCGDLQSGSRRAEKDAAHLGIILLKSLDVAGV